MTARNTPRKGTGPKAAAEAGIPDVAGGAGPAYNLGPVPADNQPGHHPPVDQDKPTGPPPTPAGSVPRTTKFAFRFDPLTGAANYAVGVVPSRTWVEVGESELTVRFGPWTLQTPLANVESAELTDTFSMVDVAAPPHASLLSSEVTFASSTEPGARVCFRDAVPGVLPVSLVRHKSVRLTVSDPRAFVDELEAAMRRDRRAA